MQASDKETRSDLIYHVGCMPERMNFFDFNGNFVHSNLFNTEDF